jgi:hypothetical protein
VIRVRVFGRMADSVIFPGACVKSEISEAAFEPVAAAAASVGSETGSHRHGGASKWVAAFLARRKAP